jgi:hypothetical protein
MTPTYRFANRSSSARGALAAIVAVVVTIALWHYGAPLVAARTRVDSATPIAQAIVPAAAATAASAAVRVVIATPRECRIEAGIDTNCVFE